MQQAEAISRRLKTAIIMLKNAAKADAESGHPEDAHYTLERVAEMETSLADYEATLAEVAKEMETT